MVSWGYAFKRGVILWLWATMWGILGTIIALIISGGSLFVYISGYIANPSSPPTANLAVVAGIIIGSLITSIGGYATIVKIVLESAEQTKKPPPP